MGRGIGPYGVLDQMNNEAMSLPSVVEVREMQVLGSCDVRVDENMNPTQEGWTYGCRVHSNAIR